MTDTAPAAGDVVFHVFGAIAHVERRLVGERARGGIAAVVANGKRPGRPPLDQARPEAALRRAAFSLSHDGSDSAGRAHRELQGRASADNQEVS